MKRILGVTAMVTAALLVSGCSMAYGDGSSAEPLVTGDVHDSEQVLETLRFAEKIELKKAAFSMNDVYSVTADGVKLGEIRGQYIYVLGDTYSFFSEAGNLVASEGEAYRLLTAEAKLFDYNNLPSGSIKENVSWPLTNWSIYDGEDKLVGKAQQNLSLTLDFTVNDAEGEGQYRLNKNMFSLFGAELSITRVSNEPTISAMDAVWLAAITNEIAEAQDEKNSNS